MFRLFDLTRDFFAIISAACNAASALEVGRRPAPEALEKLGIDPDALPVNLR